MLYFHPYARVMRVTWDGQWAPPGGPWGRSLFVRLLHHVPGAWARPLAFRLRLPQRDQLCAYGPPLRFNGYPPFSHSIYLGLGVSCGPPDMLWQGIFDGAWSCVDFGHQHAEALQSFVT